MKRIVTLVIAIMLILFSSSAYALDISHSTISIGSNHKSVWSVNGEEFTITGNNSKTIVTDEGTYTFYADGTFAKVYEKETIQKVQQALNDAGYNCGTPDGIAGKKTAAAITDYQMSNGMSVTGTIDDELLSMLELIEVDSIYEDTENENRETRTLETVEYSFQNIPWWSSPDDVKAILIEKGIIKEDCWFYVDENNGTACMPALETPKDDKAWDNVTSAWNSHPIEGAGAFCIINNNDILKTIGGYNVSFIVFEFLYGVENGQIMDDLHLSTVFIAFKDDNATFSGLSEQLESVYGEPTTKTALGTFAFANTTYIWEGENNTAILQTSYQANGIGPLCYAKSDAYITAQLIMDIIEGSKDPIQDAGL